MQSALYARIKVLFLFLLATGLFFISDWRLIALLAVVQLILWVAAGLDHSPLMGVMKRLKWFFILVIISYLLIPPASTAADFELDLGFYILKFYLSGLEHAGLMLSRVLILVLNSLWVRLTEPAGAFVKALGQFGIPETVAIVIDAGLSLTAGDKKGGDGSGQGKNRNSGKDKTEAKGEGNKGGRLQNTRVLFADIRQGRLEFVDKLIGNAFSKAGAYMAERYPQMDATVRRDASIILMVVVAIMSLKLLQLLPGIPFASGHKNLLVIPLLLLAAMATSNRFGGLAAGFAVGIVSFLMGYGKFGVFEILQFALPGLMADILLPVLVRGTGAMLLIKLAILGALIGLTRFAANFMVLMLVGAPELAWIVFIPMLISQVVFGSLSCLVCVYVVNKFRNNKLLTT